MARIAGVDLHPNKQIQVALTQIFGIGKSRAAAIVDQANIDGTLRTHELSPEEVARVRTIIEDNYRVEGDLRKDVSMNIKRLMDIGCYRGLRHRAGLPVRGQKTHANARTRKGRRKTVAGKKKAPRK